MGRSGISSTVFLPTDSRSAVAASAFFPAESSLLSVSLLCVCVCVCVCVWHSCFLSDNQLIAASGFVTLHSLQNQTHTHTHFHPLTFYSHLNQNTEVVSNTFKCVQMKQHQILKGSGSDLLGLCHEMIFVFVALQKKSVRSDVLCF